MHLKRVKMMAIFPHVFVFLPYEPDLSEVREGLRAETSRGQVLFGFVPGGAAPTHQAGRSVG
jgi:hypothetical protein